MGYKRLIHHTISLAPNYRRQTLAAVVAQGRAAMRPAMGRGKAAAMAVAAGLVIGLAVAAIL